MERTIASVVMLAMVGACGPRVSVEAGGPGGTTSAGDDGETSGTTVADDSAGTATASGGSGGGTSGASAATAADGSAGTTGTSAGTWGETFCPPEDPDAVQVFFSLDPWPVDLHDGGVCQVAQVTNTPLETVLTLTCGAAPDESTVTITYGSESGHHVPPPLSEGETVVYAGSLLPFGLTIAYLRFALHRPPEQGGELIVAGHWGGPLGEPDPYYYDDGESFTEFLDDGISVSAGAPACVIDPEGGCTTWRKLHLTLQEGDEVAEVLPPGQAQVGSIRMLADRAVERVETDCLHVLPGSYHLLLERVP